MGKEPLWFPDWKRKQKKEDTLRRVKERGESIIPVAPVKHTCQFGNWCCQRCTAQHHVDVFRRWYSDPYSDPVPTGVILDVFSIWIDNTDIDDDGLAISLLNKEWQRRWNLK
jgi:hypothetical protein